MFASFQALRVIVYYVISDNFAQLFKLSLLYYTNIDNLSLSSKLPAFDIIIAYVLNAFTLLTLLLLKSFYKNVTFSAIPFKIKTVVLSNNSRITKSGSHIYPLYLKYWYHLQHIVLCHLHKISALVREKDINVRSGLSRLLLHQYGSRSAPLQ